MARQSNPKEVAQAVNLGGTAQERTRERQEKPSRKVVLNPVKPWTLVNAILAQVSAKSRVSEAAIP